MECVGGHWTIVGQCETHYGDTTITSDNIEKLSRKQLAQPQIMEHQKFPRKYLISFVIPMNGGVNMMQVNEIQ